MKPEALTCTTMSSVRSFLRVEEKVYFSRML